nr:uncharacterized protein LOC119175908 [Rhipicephalus microplus]
MPASQKKFTKIHPPAETPMELASASDENEAPLQEIVADQNMLQEHAPTSHSELMRAFAALESQLATANNQALKQQTELAEQAVQLSKARAALAICQPELETSKNKIEAQSKELDVLRSELLTSQHSIEKLKTQYAPFSIERFLDCDEEIQFYTRLPDYGGFQDLLDYLEHGENGCNIMRHPTTRIHKNMDYRGRPQKVSVQNQLFMVLIKLRLGVFHQHLGHLFSVSVENIFHLGGLHVPTVDRIDVMAVTASY